MQEAGPGRQNGCPQQTHVLWACQGSGMISVYFGKHLSTPETLQWGFPSAQGQVGGEWEVDSVFPSDEDLRAESAEL